ncbi:MAG: GGDEF domain-containing protein [Fusobacteriota bacterium]
MKLSKYTHKKILKIIVVSSAIFIMTILIFIYLLYSNSKKDALKKRNIITKLLDNEIYSEMKLLRLIRKDQELNLFLEEGVMIDPSFQKKKFGDALYYRYTKKAIDKYRIISNQIYHVDGYEKNRSLEIYDKKWKKILGNEDLGPLSFGVLENIDFKLDIGEQYFWTLHGNELYVRLYGLSEKREHVIILNRKITEKNIINLIPKGLKVNLTIDRGDILEPWSFRTSQVSGKNLLKDINLRIINNKLTWVLKQPMYDQRQNKLGDFHYLIETSLLNYIFYLIFVGLILNFLLIMSLLKLSKENGDLLNQVIENQKRLLETGEVEYVTDIEEEKEIIDKIEEYVKVVKNREETIMQKVNKKTEELEKVNKEVVWENDFFKALTKKENQDEVISFAFDKVSEIKRLEKIEFYLFPREIDKISKIKIDERREIIHEEVDEIGVDEIQDEDSERQLLKIIENQSISKGIIRLVFKENVKDYERTRLKNIILIIAIILKSIGFYKNAIKDKLTGVYNRTLLDVYTKELAKRKKRRGDKFTLLMLDIDHFKDINDKYGHILGDKVLRHLVKNIEGELRDMDIIFRYGGEEFIIILPETNLEEGRIVAEKIRKVIASHPVKVEGDGEINYTISLGVAEFDLKKHDCVKDLLSDVDGKLYLAKELGRNKVQY